jgi:hypothetical protein
MSGPFIPKMRKRSCPKVIGSGGCISLKVLIPKYRVIPEITLNKKKIRNTTIGR